MRKPLQSEVPMPFLALIALALAAGIVVLIIAAQSSGVVYVGKTRSGLTVVHDDHHITGERIRVLNVAGTYQSATYLDDRWCDPVFPYHLLFDHLFEPFAGTEAPSSIAVLGGGGYAYPKHLIAHHPKVKRVDVVEIDPGIERIARKFFFLDRLEETYGTKTSKRLRLHVDDAGAWLRRQHRKFDVIINDCFSALEPEAAFMSPEGAWLVADHLSSNGVYLTNVVSALEGEYASPLYATVDALSRFFAHVWVYPCSGDEPSLRDNNVVVATNSNHQFAGAWEWPAPKEYE